MFEPWLHDPGRTLLLTHANGLAPGADLGRIYRNQREHDPLDIHQAREIASAEDPIPVGILYQNPAGPCYEDLRGAGRPRTAESIRRGLEAEFDKFTIWPDAQPGRQAA
jgi:2-oxoglutarate ferredoxin oxidoreductase subunit beta